MPNKNYRKGADRERKIVNEFKDQGWISFRSAGSHSPIDVVAINPSFGVIKLIQMKTGKSYSKKFKEKLQSSLQYIDGTYEVFVEVQE